MPSDQVLEIMRQAVKVTVMISAPLLIFGLVVGVATNVLQAATQISETSLQVVPKLIAIAAALVLFSPWMIDIMSDFTIQLFESIPSAIR